LQQQLYFVHVASLRRGMKQSASLLVDLINIGATEKPNELDKVNGRVCVHKRFQF
jgi:hypothetical protein